jgi:hypothetical protein
MIRIAIPTYKRSDSIASRTLKFLKSVAYPKDLIYLFVVAEEEELYKKLPADLYGQIVLGPVGLCAMRNRISEFFEVNLEDVSKKFNYELDVRENIDMLDGNPYEAEVIVRGRNV